MAQYPKRDYKMFPNNQPKDGQLHVYRLLGGQWLGVCYDAYRGVWRTLKLMDAELRRPEAMRQTRAAAHPV